LVRDARKIPKDNYRKLPEGSVLDGWTLSKIGKDQVVFTQDGGGEKVLQLRKPKAKQEPNKANNPNNPEQQPVSEDVNQEAPPPEFEPEPTEEPIENE